MPARTAAIGWYSMDRDLKTREHPPVDLDRAIAIADEFCARGGRVYEYAEEALSATTFGFSRSPTQFIELCAHGATEISFRYEYADPNASWWRRTFGGAFHHEATLRSRNELIRRIEQFFVLHPTAMKAALRNLA